MNFQDYAALCIGCASVAVDPDDPKTELLHTSLLSSQVLFDWTSGGRNLSGDAFRLDLGFLEDQRPNAFADRWQGTYMIGLHNALFISVMEFALFCFTQKGFFPHIGASDGESSPPPWDGRVPGIWLIDFTKDGGHVTDEHSRHLIPKDTDRYLMAVNLGWLMTRFIWLHELSHCFNGHVDLAKDRKLAVRLYELEDVPAHLVGLRRKPRAQADAATLRCLEFDADQSAFWSSFNVQQRGLENIEAIRALPLDLRHRLTFFGAYASIWLIEQYQAYLDIQDGGDHPAPQLRLQNLFRTASDHILKRHPEVASLHDDAISQFDALTAAIPTMYSSQMAARLRDAELMLELRLYDARLVFLKEELRAYEFSTQQG